MPKKKKEDVKEETIVDTSAIMKELTSYVDSQLEERLEKVVNDSLRKSVIEEIEKANKRVIRMKNRKIIVKDIFLILFFAIIVFLVYLLYSNHYFDQYFSHSTNSETTSVVEKGTEKEENILEVNEPTLDELKEKYSSYLDLYILSEKSIYLEDFYQCNLTKELKNYFSVNQMDFSKLEVEDDYNLIQSSALRNACLMLFDSGCDSIHFDYNGNNIRYFKKLDSYVTDSMLEKEDTLIQREIIDIVEDNDTVSITTIEGIVVGEQLYSIVPNEFISDYYGEGFQNYSDQLNKVVYTFKNKKLQMIEKG